MISAKSFVVEVSWEILLNPAFRQLCVLEVLSVYRVVHRDSRGSPLGGSNSYKEPPVLPASTMAQPSAPPLQDKSALSSHQEAPLAPCYPEPPPPYTPNDPGVSVGPAPTAQPTGPYLQQPPVPVMAAPPVQPPVQMVVAPAAQPSQVIVVGAGLAPGTCTVCRNGKMKNSASFWTWLCCCLLLPFGILPSLIIFCCCCRGPKCTKCGYTP